MIENLIMYHQLGATKWLRRRWLFSWLGRLSGFIYTNIDLGSIVEPLGITRTFQNDET